MAVDGYRGPLGSVPNAGGPAMRRLVGEVPRRFNDHRRADIAEGRLCPIRPPGMRRVLLDRVDLDALLVGAKGAPERS